MARIAINGLGRIGRAALKQAVEAPGLEVAAVNDLAPAETVVYLLRYDSVYGRYGWPVRLEGPNLVLGGTKCVLLQEEDPSRLPWADLGIDLVLECTGAFNTRAGLEQYLRSGARYVILSAPAKDQDIPTVVHGVNEPPVGSEQVISCASCTTNCVAPVVEILDRRVGIRKATMTTAHAYTATQSVVDGAKRKIRRGRAAGVNLVPSSTGAAEATTRALPDLAGRFDGIAVRAPVPAGSLADIVALVARHTSVQEVNAIFVAEARSDRYKGILGVTEDPVVSSDILGEPRAAIVDLGLTQVVDGDLVKVMSWYDNEWGYASQLVREARRLLGRAAS